MQVNCPVSEKGKKTIFIITSDELRRVAGIPQIKRTRTWLLTDVRSRLVRLLASSHIWRYCHGFASGQTGLFHQLLYDLTVSTLERMLSCWLAPPARRHPRRRSRIGSCSSGSNSLCRSRRIVAAIATATTAVKEESRPPRLVGRSCWKGSKEGRSHFDKGAGTAERRRQGWMR